MKNKKGLQMLFVLFFTLLFIPSISAVIIDDFEGASGYRTDFWDTVGGTKNNTVFKSFANSIWIPETSSELFYSIPSVTAFNYVDTLLVWVYIPVLPSSTVHRAGIRSQFVEQSDFRYHDLGINYNYNESYFVYRNHTDYHSTSVPIIANKWYGLMMKVHPNYTVEYFINNGSYFKSVGITDANSLTRIQDVSLISGGGTSNWGINFDYFVMSNNTDYFENTTYNINFSDEFVTNNVSFWTYQDDNLLFNNYYETYLKKGLIMVGSDDGLEVSQPTISSINITLPSTDYYSYLYQTTIFANVSNGVQKSLLIAGFYGLGATGGALGRRSYTNYYFAYPSTLISGGNLRFFEGDFFIGGYNSTLVVPFVDNVQYDLGILIYTNNCSVVPIVNGTEYTEAGFKNCTYLGLGTKNMKIAFDYMVGGTTDDMVMFVDNVNLTFIERKHNFTFNYSISNINAPTSTIKVNLTCYDSYYPTNTYQVDFDTTQLVDKAYNNNTLYQNTTTVVNNYNLNALTMNCINPENDLSYILYPPFFNVTFWETTSVLNFTIYYRCSAGDWVNNLDFYVNGLGMKSYSLNCDDNLNTIEDTYDNYFIERYGVSWVWSFTPDSLAHYTYSRVFTYTTKVASSSNTSAFDIFSQGANKNVFGNQQIGILFLLMIVLIILFSMGVPKEFALLLLIPFAFALAVWVKWVFITLLLIIGFMFAVALTKLFGQQY
jgi:hypothetical protein